LPGFINDMKEINMSLKNFLSVTIRWISVVLIGLLGLFLIMASPISGLFIILSAISLSPTISKKIEHIPGYKFLFPILLITGLVMLVTQVKEDMAKKEAEHVAQEEAERAERQLKAAATLAAKKQEFSEQRESIMAALSVLLNNKQYKEVVAKGGEYVNFDKDLANLVDKAQQALMAQAKAERLAQEAEERRKQEQILAEKRQKQEKILLDELENLPEDKAEERAIRYRALVKLFPDKKLYQENLTLLDIKLETEHLALKKAAAEKKTQEIIIQLKSTPVSDYEKNESLYKTLVELNPDMAKYKEKLAHYSAKLKEKKAQELAEATKRQQEQQQRLTKFGEKPTKNAWDGSYLPVKLYLKQIAHDPDSIDIIGCTDVYEADDGWLVGCDYRGKNLFGALIKQSNWFTIRRDEVVQKHAPSAYSVK